jgi:NADPH:quinone reductase-like Zn-dependent oxidoreductase
LKCCELQGPSGINGLTLVDKPVTQPGERQVLVRLKAATLNYRDLLIIKGGYGSRQKFPLVPLSDGAGLIEAVGSGVREFAVGDRKVILIRGGIPTKQHCKSVMPKCSIRPSGPCSLVSSLLLVRATMSQDSSLTQSGRTVRQALTAYRSMQYLTCMYLPAYHALMHKHNG